MSAKKFTNIHTNEASTSQEYSSKAWSQKFTLEFIDLLRSMDFMWNMQHPDYQNKNMRDFGYKRLMMKAKQVDPTATVSDVKKKLKGLRTNLRRMERRVDEYRQNGLELAPSLFYYGPLSFLLDQNRHSAEATGGARKRQRLSSADSSTLVTDDCSIGEEENRADHEVETKEELYGETQDDYQEEDEVMDEATISYRDAMSAETFGQYLAAKMISVERLQRVYLEKIVNDAIYHAELGNLTATTRLYKEQRFNNSQESYMVDLSAHSDDKMQYVVGEGQNGSEVVEYIVDHPIPAVSEGTENVNVEYLRHVKSDPNSSQVLVHRNTSNVNIPAQRLDEAMQHPVLVLNSEDHLQPALGALKDIQIIGHIRQNGEIFVPQMQNNVKIFDNVNMQKNGRALAKHMQNAADALKVSPIIRLPQAHENGEFIVPHSLHSQSNKIARTSPVKVHSLPAGAVLQKIDDRLKVTSSNGLVTLASIPLTKFANGSPEERAQDSPKINILNDIAKMHSYYDTSKTQAATNGAEAAHRQGVIVHNTEGGIKRYVIKEGTSEVLKNVHFADEDDLIKMCEDDGITILCVDNQQV